ncbi:MAG: hypothetical protein K2X50_07885, partial [Gammaproteobacteria bacterium]|nr:hypothetical protein [Gammaproteobacteria bacterium]
DKHLQLTTDTFFYNWWRQPAMHGLPGIAERSSLELYCAHPNDAPKTVIVLGSGLAILWLARHFPLTKFLALKRKSDQFPETPRIRLRDLTNLTALNVDDVQYSVITPTKLLVKNLKTGEEFEGDFYKAIGFTTFPDTLKVIPSTHKIELNTDMVGKWNAPQVIPEGALLESLMRWHTLTQTIDWVFEPLAYHDDSGFPEIMSREMRKIGIELKVAFFNALSEIIQNLQDFSEATNVGEIFLQAFDIQKPTDEEKQRFSNKLNELLNRYHPKPTSAPLESKFWKNVDRTPKRSYSTTGQIEIKNRDPKLELIEKLLEKWWHWSPEGDIRNFLSEPTKTNFRQGNELLKSLEQTPELQKVSKY